jgi:hypothetical protein
MIVGKFSELAILYDRELGELADNYETFDYEIEDAEQKRLGLTPTGLRWTIEPRLDRFLLSGGQSCRGKRQPWW